METAFLSKWVPNYVQAANQSDSQNFFANELRQPQLVRLSKQTVECSSALIKSFYGEYHTMEQQRGTRVQKVRTTHLVC